MYIIHSILYIYMYIYIYICIYSFYSIISHCCRSNILAFVWLNQSFGFNLVSPLVFRFTHRCVLPMSVRIFVVQHNKLTSPCLFVNLQLSFWWFKEKTAGNHVIYIYDHVICRKSCYIMLYLYIFLVNLTLNSPAFCNGIFTLQPLVPLLLKSKPPRPNGAP